MAHFFDYTRPRGYLEIIKIQDGEREVIFSDHNDICIGMGQTLAALFDPTNPKEVGEYRIKFFQLGKLTGTDGSATRECSSVFNGADYGANTDLELIYKTVFKTSPSTQAMAKIDDQLITPGSNDRITFSIALGPNDANTTISEIALLSKDPIKGTEASPIVAYRTFPTITKTSSFDLSIQWTIEF